MPEQTVMWTALPNGITGDAGSRRLRLSVFVSLRLKADGPEGPLSTFPDVEKWPDRLQLGQARFMVRIPGFGDIPAQTVSEPPGDLWGHLFRSTTLVRSHHFDDLTGLPFSPLPASDLHRHLREGYQVVAASSPIHRPRRSTVDAAFPVRLAMRHAGSPGPEDLGPAGDVRGRLKRDLFRMADRRASIATALAEARRVARNTPLAYTEVIEGDGSQEASLAQLAAFHYSSEEGDDRRSAPPPMDFHEALTALGDHPILLYRLGLLFDLELPLASVPQSSGAGSAARRLQVLPMLARPLPPQVHSPFTAYTLEGDTVFLPAVAPAPRTSSARFGFLSVHEPGKYDLLQIDVDGAGLKLINMSVTPGGPASPPPVHEFEREAVPALRSSGIWVAWVGRSRSVQEAVRINAENRPILERAGEITFFNEDLVRGYRMDVRDGKTGQWQSLHKRRGRYTIVPEHDPPITINGADEGASLPAVTQRQASARETGVGNIYVHESLLHWQGWSLAAPRPGKALGEDGFVEVTNFAPADGFPVQVAFKPEDHSLPRLRFGTGYRFRIRTVDLAGNGLTVDEATAFLENVGPLLGHVPVIPTESRDFIYRRFEPIAPPTLVPMEKYSEGESLECLVIRSNRGVDPTQYARTLTAMTGFRTLYRGSNDRHVVTPKTSLTMIEMLGLLDEAFGARPGETDAAFRQRTAKAYRLGRKEKGQLGDQEIVDTSTGLRVPIPPTPFADPQTGVTVSRPSVEVIPTNPEARDAPTRGYVVHHEPQLRLPYLPDPLSFGAALFGLPGVGQGQAVQLDDRDELSPPRQSLLPEEVIAELRSTTHIRFAAPGRWPDQLPFRIQIVEPTAPNAHLGWDRQGRVLVIPLGKAESVSVRLSSFLASSRDIELLGIWQWMLEHNSSAGLPPPGPGVIQAALAGAFWMMTPFRDITLVHAVQQPLVDPEIRVLGECLEENVGQVMDEEGFQGSLNPIVTASDAGRACAFLFGEIAIHGKSTIRIDLEGNWQETADIPSEPKPRPPISMRATVAALDVHLPQEGSGDSAVDTTILPIVPGVRYVAGEDKMQFSFVRHEFGDTKHRVVQYKATGTTRFRDYFPPEITGQRDSLVRTGASVQLSIRSKARPAAPHVVQVLPTFKHTVTPPQPSGAQTRTRLGSGVRVYLARPWFSSGDGELLGVVLSQTGAPPDHAFATDWGVDPIWQTEPTAATLGPAQFGNAVAHAPELTIAEDNRVTVSVAAHAVQFDERRKLWFSDVDVDLGQSYFPFLRLVLARYQPSSVRNAHLSPVIVTGFIQLPPNRTVTVTPLDADRFTIRVDGLTYRRNAWHPGTTGGSLEVPLPSGGSLPINPPRNLVKISFQERVPGTTDDAGWIASSVGRFEVSQAVEAGGGAATGTALWEGTVKLPAGRQPGQFRVVLREHEIFIDDHKEFMEVDVNVPPDPLPPGTTPPSVEQVPFYRGQDRLVFADAIAL